MTLRLDRGMSVDVDVTPNNWHFGNYFARAHAVHEWIAAESTPERLGDISPNGPLGLAELQAVTVSVQKPHVVLRVFLTENRTAGEVADFADRVRRDLEKALEPAPRIGSVSISDVAASMKALATGTIFPEGL